MSVAVPVVEQDIEVVSNPSTEPADVSPEVQAETELTAEVVRLWGRHQKVATTTKKTRVELQAIREELGCKLAEVKALICKVGRRGGEWGKFLEDHAIPRATASRLVRKYGQCSGQLENDPNEQVSLETKIEKFRETVVKRGNRLLPHEYAKYHFIVGLAKEFDLLDGDGDLIEEPEEPEDEMEPYDDELGDDQFMPSGDSPDEVPEPDYEEPALGGVDETSTIVSGEEKVEIVL
jgi:hypothetical protein